MTRTHYQSPSYRPELVAGRYVRRIGDNLYRVYECAAKRKAKNRDKQLTRFGSGPTLREYDCDASHLPAWLIERMGKLHVMWEWPI